MRELYNSIRYIFALIGGHRRNSRRVYKPLFKKANYMDYLFEILKDVGLASLIIFGLMYRRQIKFILCIFYMFYMATLSTYISLFWVYPNTRVLIGVIFLQQWWSEQLFWFLGIKKRMLSTSQPLYATRENNTLLMGMRLDQLVQ